MPPDAVCSCFATERIKLIHPPFPLRPIKRIQRRLGCKEQAAAIERFGAGVEGAELIARGEA